MAVAVSLPALLYVTAERGHAAEAAGRVVLAGLVLLPPAQTVQHDGDGSAGEPALQQRQASAEAPYGINPDRIRGTEEKGNLEWLDKNKSSFLIMWRRPEEWGKLIYQWVSRSGQNNSVFTLYELTNGEDTEDEEFHGLDEATLLRALQALQQEHKAELITISDGRGVKFF